MTGAAGALITAFSIAAIGVIITTLDYLAERQDRKKAAAAPPLRSPCHRLPTGPSCQN
jgi:hypothetical protein